MAKTEIPEGAGDEVTVVVAQHRTRVQWAWWRWLCYTLSPNLGYTGCSCRPWVLPNPQTADPSFPGQIPRTGHRSGVLSSGSGSTSAISSNGQGPSPPWLSFPSCTKVVCPKACSALRPWMVTCSRSLASWGDHHKCCRQLYSATQE